MTCYCWLTHLKLDVKIDGVPPFAQRYILSTGILVIINVIFTDKTHGDMLLLVTHLKEEGVVPFA